MQTLVDHLAAWVQEAMDLTYSAQVPDLSVAPISTAAEALTDIRRRMDRVQELFAKVMQLRASAHRNAIAAKALADDAWDSAAMKRRAAPVQRGEEFYSAREREAEANLASLAQIRAMREAAELHHRCDEAYEVIRLHHRGLERVRADILATLRSVQFESHLER